MWVTNSLRSPAVMASRTVYATCFPFGETCTWPTKRTASTASGDHFAGLALGSSADATDIGSSTSGAANAAAQKLVPVIALLPVEAASADYTLDVTDRSTAKRDGLLLGDLDGG